MASRGGFAPAANRFGDSQQLASADAKSAAIGAHPQPAVAIVQDLVDAVTEQPMRRAHRHHLRRLRRIGTGPQYTDAAVLGHQQGGVVAEMDVADVGREVAVAGAVALQRIAREARQPAAMTAVPQCAVARLSNHADGAIGQRIAGGVALPDASGIAPIQAGFRAGPEHAVAVEEQHLDPRACDRRLRLRQANRPIRLPPDN